MSGHAHRTLFGLVLITFFLSLLALPFFSHADGLVPCGGAGEPECQFCHFYVTGKRVIDATIGPPGVVSTISVGLIYPLAAVGIAFGAVYILISGARQEWIERGKKAIYYSVWGIIVSLLAWLFINTALLVLADPDTFPWPWNEFPACGEATDGGQDDTGGDNDDPFGFPFDPGGPLPDPENDPLEVFLTGAPPGELQQPFEITAPASSNVTLTWAISGPYDRCDRTVQPLLFDEDWKDTGGIPSRNGSYTTVPITSPATYTISCFNEEESASASVLVNITQCELIGGTGPVDIVIWAEDLNGCTENCPQDDVDAYLSWAENFVSVKHDPFNTDLYTVYQSNTVGSNGCSGVSTDLNILFTQNLFAGSGSCGDAFPGSVKLNSQMATGDSACHPITTFHEMGHALGNLHDEYENATKTDQEIIQIYTVQGPQNCFAGDATKLDDGQIDASNYCQSLGGEPEVIKGCLYSGPDRTITFPGGVSVSGGPKQMWACGDHNNLMFGPIVGFSRAQGILICQKLQSDYGYTCP